MPSSTGTLAPQGLGRYKVQAPDGRRDPYADSAKPSLATSAAMPGLPGTAPIALDPSRKVSHTALQQALEEPMATRPRANPIHHQFETGPSQSSHVMRSHLFTVPGR